MDKVRILEEKGILVAGRFPNQSQFKISATVITQKYCKNGLPYDIAISWLQKAIRRGRPDEAQYCAASIGSLKGIFMSHLLNRLVVIASEDIGCANNNAIILASKTYFEALEKRKNRKKDSYLCDDDPVLLSSIMNLVCYMANSKKSRAVDWIVYNAQNTDTDIDVDIDVDVDFSYALNNGLILKAVRIIFNDQEFSSIRIEDKLKRKNVFKYWKLMIEYIKSKEQLIEIETVTQLYKLFCIRHDPLQIVHALLVCMNYSALLGTDTETEHLDWETALSLNPKVLDVAIDRHTHIGKYVLGRSMKHFVNEGCILNKWTPISNELDDLKNIKEQYHESIKTMNIFDHQQNAVDNLISEYKSESESKRNVSLGLNFPCGMGKTLISMQFFLNVIQTKNTNTISCIVIPKLELLKQFMHEWSSFLTSNKVNSWIHVCASIHLEKDKYQTDHVYWEKYIPGCVINKGFCHKIIMTTYASLSKVSHMDYDIVIFDEAHRRTEKNKLYGNVDICLEVTATPKQIIRNSVNCYLNEAISLGFLTDYKMAFNISISEALNKCNKLIVYCKNIVESELFYHLIKKTVTSERPVLLLTSNQTSDIKKQSIEIFKKEQHAVIINCRMLIEGIDIPDCNGIYLTYNTKSETMLVQTLGRAIRKHPDKQVGMYMFRDHTDTKIIDKLRKYDEEIDTRLEVS